MTRRRVDSPVPPVSPLVAPVASSADLGVPNYGNQVLQSLQLPNGLATIESIQASAQSAENLTLDSPFGLDSQRVQRAKSRLSIAM